MQTIWDFDYTGSEQSVTLKPGKYKLECWGASGGITSVSSFHLGALGGYVNGELLLNKITTLYVYVGQSGYERVPRSVGTLTRNGFNGGGTCGGVYVDDYLYSKNGGGATDIRLSDGSWSDSKGLLSRILVAGGGGGIDGYSSHPHKSIGHGGGTEGYDGIDYSDNFTGGGSQYQGGRSIDTKDCYGSFGKGGRGGWFGGAGSEYNDVAGGGSGYTLTKDSYKPQGYIPTSEFYLKNVTIITGSNTTRADGRAKITLLQALSFLTVSSYNSTQATFKADHTDATLLTKIEYFIDDVLKETITTDLTIEKTINYTLEDNALHTLKIVVTDSANATAEQTVTISKGIAPLPTDANLQDISTKLAEIGEGFRNGKTSIINTLALKNIEATLNNTLVELSEKVKVSFDSGDASLGQLQNQLTNANNTISQLNSKYKHANGYATSTTTGNIMQVANYNGGYIQKWNEWININNIGYKPNIFIAEYDYVDDGAKRKNFVFACCSFPTLSSIDFVLICDLYSKGVNYGWAVNKLQLFNNNRYEVKITDNSIQLPVHLAVNSNVSYYWNAIKFI